MKSIIYNEGIEVHFLKEAQDTDNKYCEFLCVIKAGARNPMPHYHKSFDETVFGEKGIVTWTVDGKTTAVGPGEKLFIPRGVTHMFENKTNQAIEFRCQTTPADVFGPGYFEDIATVLNIDGIPDFKKLQSVMTQHGLIPVPGFKRKIIFGILGLIRKIKGVK